MGVGAWLIAHTIHRYWAGSQIPKDMASWVSELEFALRDLHGAEVHRAACYRRVADMIGQMPKDFDAVALTGMVMSDQVGVAILEKAEQMGLYPPGTFAKLGVGARPTVPQVEQALPAVDAERHSTMLPPPGGAKTVTPWIGTWEGGRLVPPSVEDN
jgi:hypothetical protein